jgi:hypothetical protein
LEEIIRRKRIELAKLQKIQATQEKLADQNAKLHRKGVRLADGVRELQARLIDLEKEVQNREKKIGALNDKELELRHANVEAQNRERKLNKLAKQLENRERHLRKEDNRARLREKELRQKEKHIVRLQSSVKRSRESVDVQLKKLGSEKRKFRDASKKSELTKLENRLSRAKSQSARQRSELEYWHKFAGPLDWMKRELGDAPPWPFEEVVVVVGDGPYPKVNMKRFLRGSGFDIGQPGDEDSRLLIVGREHWSEEFLERQIQARQGQELRVYSQEMFLVTTALSRDPLDDCDEAELISFFGEGHSALEFLIGSDLRWPRTVPTMFSNRPSISGVEESPLHKLGYRVGKTSTLTERERYAKLRQAFTGKLPLVDSDEYMREWGRPKSPRRLWRMAHHVAYLARTQGQGKQVAGTDWSNDLQWMKKTFLKPWMRFRWPRTQVPRDV